MKKLKFYLATFILLFLLTPSLQSCLDDEDADNRYFAIGTLQVIEGKDYFFHLDDGSKIYPGDTTYIHHYPLVNNQRAFIHYTPLEESIAGYDCNARILEIENILTKNIIPLTEATADSIGNDRINLMDNPWITGNYVNIQYQFYHSNQDIKHMLNLVINKTAINDNEDADYLYLEFRHNAFKDEPHATGWGVVSFKLENIAEQIIGKKGLKIRVNTIYDGQRTYTVDLKK